MRAWHTGVITVVTAAALVGIGTLGAITAAADDGVPDDGGYPISVTVIGTTPPPTPSPAASTSPPKSGTPTPATTTVGGAGSTPAPTAPPQLETLGGANIGGVLYISGVSTHYVPSLNPSQGEVRASFTIRNVSTTTVDSTTAFRLTNFLGMPLSSSDRVLILRLEPNESRVVRATLLNAGQWALTTASFTLTPTTVVDGERLPSYTRDSNVFFLPWLIIVIIVMGGATYAIARIARVRPAPVEEFG